jgi:hypothetical protein
MQRHFAALSRSRRGEGIFELSGDERAAEVSRAQAPWRDSERAMTEGFHREHSESFGYIDIDPDANKMMHGVPMTPPVGQAVAEGTFNPSILGDSLLDLEQHRGVYARMGSLAPPAVLEVRSANECVMHKVECSRLFRLYMHAEYCSEPSTSILICKHLHTYMSCLLSLLS